jgi:hypothetical protein
MIDLEGTDRETKHKTRGRLVLVDLAGSERVRSLSMRGRGRGWA